MNIVPLTTNTEDAAVDAIDAKLLACVHCGFCLEACPTYLQTGNENDSPRGRIYLMRAAREGRLSYGSKTFERHINRCLGCRACEPVCPAGVQYGELLEAARTELFQISDSSQKQKGIKASRSVELNYLLLRFLLRHIWIKPNRLRFLFFISRLMRDSGLVWILVKTGGLKLLSPVLHFGLLLLLSSRPQNRASISRQNSFACSTCSKRVLLFRGCVTEGLFKRVNEATKRVLKINGCDVSIPKRQICCGALHAHAGDLAGARILARKNIEAFEVGAKEEPVITNAGGCGAMLLTYEHLLKDDPQFAERARAFSARVQDVSQQLEELQESSTTTIRRGESPDSSIVTCDVSCHLANGQHAGLASQKMLEFISNINLVELNGASVCCGAAGVYNLMERDLSNQILKEKIENIRKSRATIVTTGNAGCHMQIGAGACLAGLNIKVCHPVELLDESYRKAGLYD